MSGWYRFSKYFSRPPKGGNPTREELREMCTDLGLPSDGLKKDLIARIANLDMNAECGERLESQLKERKAAGEQRWRERCVRMLVESGDPSVGDMVRGLSSSCTAQPHPEMMDVCQLIWEHSAKLSDVMYVEYVHEKQPFSCTFLEMYHVEDFHLLFSATFVGERFVIRIDEIPRFGGDFVDCQLGWVFTQLDSPWPEPRAPYRCPLETGFMESPCGFRSGSVLQAV